MKTIKIAFFLCFCHLFSLAQIEDIFNEQFDDNKNDWPLESRMGYTVEITDGQLQMAQTGAARSRFFTQNILINPNEDFVIGTTIKVVEDKKNGQNGIIWGLHDRSYYIFSIDPSGNFYIMHGKDGDVEFLQEKTFSSLIKTDGSYNAIAVSRKDDKLLFFINGSIAHETLPFKFHGRWHGLVLTSNQVMVNNFVVKTTNPKINLVSNPINGLERKNLGAAINSYASEISPKISNDGTLLFVCRGGHNSNIGASSGDDQDAWYAEKTGEETWSRIKNMGRPVNDGKQNAIASVSADNNTVLINYDGRSDPGLMISHRTTTGWAAPQRVNIKNFYNHNKDAEFTLAPSGKVMVYSVERDDTYGEKDLYVSFRNSNGSWTAPKNLGATVNSFSTDFGPYLAADNVTLYFGSMGHPGYGSSDIFVTKRLDDTWTNWSTPKNLGPEINTKSWDAYYTITASGEEAYMATSGTYGNTDIFRIKLKESVDEESKPDPVVLIKGRVFDQKTKKPMAATIQYQDLKTGKEVGIARSDPRTGRYQISLPYGVHYGFQAEALGYVSVGENVDLTKVGSYKEMTKNLYLAPLKVGEVVNLQNVFFKVATSKLLAESMPELERVVQLMKDNPSLVIKIKGHTDSLGKPEILLRLSRDRAKAVRDYLVKNAISKSRIKWEGYGGAHPLVDNRNPSERYKNRRVEFEIIKY